MKWLRTLVLFNEGDIMSSEGWKAVHQSYKDAIEKIFHPIGSGALTIRNKARRPDSKVYDRNGVGYLRSHFLRNMMEIEGWKSEADVNLGKNRQQPVIFLYPSGEAYQEPIVSNFGGFDFLTSTLDGHKVAIEWETGNISSSHRSMNKLAIALKTGIIQIGVLIVPSRDLYAQLTDRIGNIAELSGYLEMWESLRPKDGRGLLAISVVEHDALSNDPSLPYLPTASDGMSGHAKRKAAKSKTKTLTKVKSKIKGEN
ncbi:hypothetical protein [Duganella violaceipulchra]|uniref:Restriction endonuclease n=1 Tax=Duganella violaceipulchra TaxID=2849652 RepID=A0AA41H990_9BURK|nr:hypothetical protein [Duganella violaceicalia]MBV6322216.1 hypothetical protein [Duganella violaceicalia]MCP2011363.1 hypothetical protein [Duganella violaceicalia]